MNLGNIHLAHFAAYVHACHEARAKTESRMRAYMAKLTNAQMESLKEGLDTAFYWFEPNAVIELLSKLRHSDENVHLAVVDLLKRRNETE